VLVFSLAAGGRAKTPLVSALASALAGRGRRPAIALRGRGPPASVRGREGGEPVARRIVCVDGVELPAWQAARRIGDEASLHAATTPGIPIWTGDDRAAAADRAADVGCDVLLLDSGLGHLDPACALCIIRCGDLGARPAVPRRYGPAALRRASMVVSLDEGPGDRHSGSVPLRRRLRWERLRDGVTVPPPTGLLVAGIGDPSAFAADARRAGAMIVEGPRLADHRGPGVFVRAFRRRRPTLPLVITGKDAVGWAERLRQRHDPLDLDDAVVAMETLDGIGPLLALVEAAT
jgi:tetraacyldisaccharide-1-P 4'-kinase